MDQDLANALFAKRTPCLETGVYILWLNSEPVYVGRSKHGALRIGEQYA